MSDCPHDGPGRYGLISEGACPRCEAPMGRHGDHGRCGCCGGCWRADSDTIELVIHGVKAPDRPGFTSRPGTLLAGMKHPVPDQEDQT